MSKRLFVFIPLAKTEEFWQLCVDVGLLTDTTTVDDAFGDLAYIGEELIYRVAGLGNLTDTTVGSLVTALKTGDYDDGSTIARWWALNFYCAAYDSSEIPVPVGYFPFDDAYTYLGVINVPITP